jgi:uncharacterized protein YegP (UPF0339 family)
MRFVVYKDRKGEWRWSLVAANGRIVADSAESYLRRATMIKTIYKIRRYMASQANVPIETEHREVIGYA